MFHYHKAFILDVGQTHAWHAGMDRLCNMIQYNKQYNFNSTINTKFLYKPHNHFHELYAIKMFTDL